MEESFQKAADRAEKLTGIKQSVLLKWIVKWFGASSDDSTALLRSATVTTPLNDSQRDKQLSRIESALDVGGYRLRVYLDVLGALDHRDESFLARETILIATKAKRLFGGDPLRSSASSSGS